ncbi:MAG: lysophospholipid acyltransferase family protein, partial [Caldimonas sp.]
LRLLDVRLDVSGVLPPKPVLLVANHVSWLDIVVIHSIEAVRFVSKADVQRWPVVGNLVAEAGTLFIERNNLRDTLRVMHDVAQMLREGASVALFPEGTTGGGRTLLPFHAGLMQAAVAARVPAQPVALRFSDRHASFSAAAAYMGATSLVASLWRIACADGLVAHVTLLPPLEAARQDRRALAAAARASIQADLDASALEGEDVEAAAGVLALA